MLRTFRRALAPVQKPAKRKSRYLPAIDELETRVLLAAQPLVVGPDAGGPPRVKVFDAATGQLKFQFMAFENNFTGGVRVATGDVTGDGIYDIICSKGTGGGSQVRVFNGRTGLPLAGTLGSFQAFGPGQTNGTYVAAGDVNMDGRADVIVGSGDGAAPWIKVFNGLNGTLLADFSAGPASSTSGTRIAAGDVNGDGVVDYITGSGPGGPARVSVLDGVTRQEFFNFYPFEYSFLGGVEVGAGDLTGDGKADILVASGPGRVAEIRAFHGADTAHLARLTAFGGSFQGGVRVASVDADNDGKADIIAGAGAPLNHVRLYDGQSLSLLRNLTPYGFGFDDGVFVGGPTSTDPDIGILSGDPAISVIASSPNASEPSTNGAFSFQRTDGPPGGISVSYSISGTGINGTDFQTLSGTVSVPPGSASVSVIPINDALIEGAETVIVTIQPGAGYTVGTPSSATVSIGDDETGQGSFPGALLPDLTMCPPEIVGTYGDMGYPVNQRTFSEGPIRYFDGTVHFANTDLASTGFGSGWGITRHWTNHAAYETNSLGGAGTVIAQLPYLRLNMTTVIVITDGSTARYFDYNFMSQTYAARYFLQEKLVQSTSNKEFTLTDTTGGRIIFHNFDATLPANKQGQFKKYIDQGGNEIAVTSYSSDNKPAEIQRSGTAGGTTTTESYVFTYLTSGTNSGEISNILQRVQVGGGSWTTIRQVDYAYYDGTTNDGNARDLKTAIIKDGSGNVIDTYYYRYYKSGEANGYTGGLQYAFSPSSYDRLKAIYSDPATATDAQVAPYADLYLEYNAAKFVKKEVVQGAGCSGCSGGLGEYLFDYSVSGFADGHNTWSRKTVETLPDGKQNIVFTNFAGQVMLDVFKEVSSGNEWKTFYKYDSNGRLVFSAAPSAVSGYDVTRPDLLYNQSGNYADLRDNEGLVEARTYYTTTTATSTTAGSVSGFLEKVELKRGETGTAVLQSSQNYFTRSAFSVTFAVPATGTAYRNTDGTGGQTTSFAYTWHGSTALPESITVTLPTVGTTQNGPGSADTMVSFFDTFGRPTWHKDGDGFLHYTSYDMATSAVTKSIVDVEDNNTSDFTGLPSGWTTPSGGGLHLLSTFEVDGLGRVTKSTSPGGRIDYVVYKDTAHEVRVYPAWNDTTDAPTGPTVVLREDRAGGYFETLTMSATPSLTSDRPNGTESIGSLESLARSYTNSAWQVTQGDSYFNLSGLTYSTSTSLGTLDTHFYRTTLAYDSRGRQNRAVSPTGTIYRTVYDALGRVSSEWVGTNDTPGSGTWSPSNNTSPANMVQTAGYVYDAGGIGDSNLTEVTAYPGSGGSNRVSKLYYDWRNRLVAAKSGHEASESTSLNRPIVYVEYDNLSQAIAAEQYDGDNITISDGNSDGVPDRPSSSRLRAKSTASFDDQGRLYRTNTFSVNQSDGTVSSSSLATDIWYGRRGQVLKTSAPGGLVSKAELDGAGRVKKSFVSDGGGDSGWSDADDVTSDKVLEQVEYTYDSNSNVTLVTSRQRFHDETGTGALVDPSTAPKARVSYAAAYYDKADRLTDSVNVGTNGGSAYTRPGTVPSRSDTVLVTSQTYDSAGLVATVTDPRGLEDRFTYDDLGRTTKTIESYVDGTPDGGSDRTTEFTYDGSGHTLTLKAHLTGSTYQTTQFVYGVTTSTSNLNSNDLLAEMRYPDKSSGDPSTSSSEKEIYTYNALGQAKTKQDRNGNVHTFSFDVVGRFTTDAVTTLGSGVNGAVRRAEVAYDTGGRAYLFTNYDASSGGNIVNQVQRDFNGLGQLTKEYQAHSGAVNTGTSPKVQYAYSEMASGANHSRPTTMTYPNGDVLNYNYTATLDAAISRLTSMTEGFDTLEGFAYLGLGTVVRRAHQQTDVDLTYIKQSGESNGDAGDQYTGLDRFGRIVDQRWIKTLDGTHRDRLKYGHDRNSNRLYRENAINAAFSELYHADGASAGYDNLDQLVEFQRGTLSDTNSDNIPDTVSTASRAQGWTLDGQGNWSSLTTDGTSVSRTHNKQNQVTAVGAASLTFDNNGNLTVDQTGKQLVFDAWNRLVEVKNSGGTTLETFKIDALGRRIADTASGTTTDLFYSAAWQLLEERIASDVKVQYTWSPVYIDALVIRDRDADGNQGNGLEERYYALHDANFNVTALINTSGTVVERYVYDAFGSVTYLAPDWSSRSSSSYAWEHLFQTLKWDTVITLYYSRHREYDPVLGRFVQTDPVGHAAGPNFYQFVLNSPTNLNDPWGLTPQQGGGIRDLELQARDVADWIFQNERWDHPAALQARARYGDTFGYADVLNILIGHFQRETAPIANATSQRYRESEAAIQAANARQEAANAQVAAEARRHEEQFWLVVGMLKAAVFEIATFFGPGSDLRDGYELATGQDANTGDKLSGTEYGLTAAGTALFFIPAHWLRKGWRWLANLFGTLSRYPQVIDPRTGRHIPFPAGVRGRVPHSERVVWNNQARAEFIREWHERGYPTPRGGWEMYDIHHIQPREFGGSNDFWNLVPVEREFRNPVTGQRECGLHQQFNDFWANFDEL